MSREFFERLCVQLFDSSNLLFRTFNEENHQALVGYRQAHIHVHVHVHACVLHDKHVAKKKFSLIPRWLHHSAKEII